MSARLTPTSIRRSPAPSARRRGRSLRTAVGTLSAVVALAGLVTVQASTQTAAQGSGAAEPAATLVAAQVAAKKKSTNPPTPGAFTGYGFDQCLAPSQAAMDVWLKHSPFLAVGIYISGNSRHCRNQPNLTPTWVSNQLAKGWKLLPITLGPQSSCVGRYPKYGKNIDPTISTSKTGSWAAARKQAVAEADTAVATARNLGIVPGSTLFYDLEGWSDYRNATCREASLAFLSAWTVQVRKLGYKSGVYSSAGSGMRVLDDARKERRSDVTLPDQIWIARWDGKANTSTSYISDAGWKKARIKQYRGGHDETWGGVKINIDSNYLDLGDSTPAKETHCGGVRVDLIRYRALKPKTASYTPSAPVVKALQCLLTEKGLYRGRITGNFNKATGKAAGAWQQATGRPTSTVRWRRLDWVTLLSAGTRPMLKTGSTGPDVRRVQRAVGAAMPKRKVPITGRYDATTAAHVAAYNKVAGAGKTGQVKSATWARLARGVY
ncbi:DUF1906 domain-containing protein [Nocardioides sp. zg-536]|uniref:DUF1906 domain-containing protein n=1 Tax=Nocardioides faecalis TaxID=2803858 RepID=A0A939BWK9_9ACTN|nr:glycoside hydrolase domain-containing protein [Nocardioides faecalis]MBM9458473.1 DUF1906 domain-containing protein [Nocardioides faecalis]QVI58486.1 DUF1906 domain-containing protein [Nocardioides faecalis]